MVKKQGPKNKPALPPMEPEPAAVDITKETPEQTLRRITNSRVSRTISDIGLCGDLVRYKPTEKQADAIVKALTDAVQAAARKLKSGSVMGSFELPEG